MFFLQIGDHGNFKRCVTMRIQDPRVHLRVEVDRQARGTQYASPLNVYKKDHCLSSVNVRKKPS